MRVFPTPGQRQYLENITMPAIASPPPAKATPPLNAPLPAEAPSSVNAPPSATAPTPVAQPAPAPPHNPAHASRSGRPTPPESPGTWLERYWFWCAVALVLLLSRCHSADAAPLEGLQHVAHTARPQSLEEAAPMIMIALLLIFLLPVNACQPFLRALRNRRARKRALTCADSPAEDRDHADDTGLKPAPAATGPGIPQKPTIEPACPPDTGPKGVLSTGPDPQTDGEALIPNPWHLGFATHRGPVRRTNEDAGRAFRVGSHDVLILADGVGGMKHGAEAAQTAVRAASRAIRQAWRISPADREPSPSLMLAAAFTAASSRLSLRGLARGFASGSDGLCTTLIVTIAAAGGFHYGYIGDGSICLLRASGELKALLHPHKADPAVQIILSACLGPTLRGTPVFGCVEREPSDLLVATTDGIADRVLPAFYSRTVPRQARRLKGDLNAAAQRVLQILAQHRDDTGFSFDDNMTLGLLGDGSPPHNADQGAEPTAPTKSAEPAPPTAEMT